MIRNSVFRCFGRVVKEKKQNYYQVLEVSHDSSQKGIKSQFQKMTKIYHPDIYKGEEKDRYSQILKAYDTLKNPIKRSKYDIEIMKISKIRSKSKEQSNHEDFDVNDRNPTAKDEQGRENMFNEYYAFNKNDVKMREEVQRMQNRKVKTDFGKIKIIETPMERMMTEHEKLRQNFVSNFNKPEKFTDHLETKLSYKEALKENIEIVNSAQQKFDKADDKVIEVSTFVKRTKAFFAFCIFGAFGVFVVIILDQKSYYRKKVDQSKNIILKEFDNMDAHEVKSRFVY
jgi:curved DNA-binding protein CbpA